MFCGSCSSSATMYEVKGSDSAALVTCSCAKFLVNVHEKMKLKKAFGLAFLRQHRSAENRYIGFITQKTVLWEAFLT